ncbi:DUF1905 domain-containing protein [Marinihelvus fidelis]|uniref:DUF1905 domain-containing protein n=1 Tax=Marinihelvus fidelis TaxID=2613842 RepID=A0A5N0T8L0_9GAMM|nr:YdeI/OmpD-associated family protein [Marinihelvus fidelis]KAA9129639.1 DUF1905 domain-containing protein [Marinihelvus fidelis]
MTRPDKPTRFKTTLQVPADPGEDPPWFFLVLPKPASDQLPRRGRTTARGLLNGAPFETLLEPDGRKSHWMRVVPSLAEAANARPGDRVSITIEPVENEPDPAIPEDFREALETRPDAAATWAETTNIARVDWVHWITSAKQARTQTKRIHDACDMLAEGKRRVCCFDPSGFYSKALSAPRAAEPATRENKP